MHKSIYAGVQRAKSRIKKLMISFTVVTTPAVMAMSGGVAMAAPGYTLFGDAEVVGGGNPGNAVQLRSDADPGFGGVDYEIPAGTTFSDLETLATDYKFESDDSCAGGSPRFQVNVEDSGSGDTGNIFAYIGPPPSYTDCPADVWLSSGDLLEGTNPIDTSQLDAGTFYDPYANALAKYGDYVVTGVQLVTDSGWAFPDGEQTVLVDNTVVDSAQYSYETASSCKKGGWQTMTDSNGNTFKNQGDCVSFFATNGRNAGNGS